MTKQPATEQALSPIEASLRTYILRVLGQPANLYAVQIRLLWQNHFRANVLVGADASDIRVAHSYFLVTDAEGNLDSSNPEIIGEYVGETLPVPQVRD